MSALALLVVLVPLAAGVATAVAGWRPATAWLAPLAAGVVTVAGVVLAVRVLDHGPVTALDDLVRVDALSAFMVIVIGLVALIATTYGVRMWERSSTWATPPPAGPASTARWSAGSSRPWRPRWWPTTWA